MNREADFEAFVTARWHALVRSAVLLGASRHEAEDITQAALERCLRSWEMVAKARDLDAYVYRVLVNTFLRSRKRRWWRERPEAVPDRAGRDLQPDPADHTAVARTVVAALRRLKPEHREVLVLRFYADLTEQQTADVLGVPVGTVKSRTARALSQTSADPSLVFLFKHEES